MKRLLVVVLSVLLPGAALAFSGGITSQTFGTQGCTLCHGGGVAPTVTLTPSATLVAPGATVTLTVVVTTPNGTRAGFNVQAEDGGTLTNPGSGAQLIDGEATHVSPKLEDAQGNVTFTVGWIAPAAPGPHGFLAWGNSVNSDGTTTGDFPSSTTASVTVCTPQTFFRDQDGDGFGNANDSVQACSAPTGYIATSGDCDDTNPAVNPGATELCNGLDDDCDGDVDEGLALLTFFRDVDADGFGDDNVTAMACVAPPGHVAVGGDCDDADPLINPAGTEVCNGKDDDCDGQTDEGLPTQTWFIDADGDGVGGAMTQANCMQPAGFVAAGGDCDDGDPAVKPGATELCNGQDDDCDGDIDEGALLTFFRDTDEDGHGDPGVTAMACAAPTGFVATGGDCDDTRADVHPGAAETCDDADEDCDGLVDDGVPLATCGLGICARTGTTCDAASCTAGLADVETCNGLDDDCNGIVDDDPDPLCPGADVCTAQADGGAACLPPAENPDAGTDPDAGLVADGGTGGEPDPAGCGCAAGAGSGGGALAGLLGMLALAFVARRRSRPLR